MDVRRLYNSRQDGRPSDARRSDRCFGGLRPVFLDDGFDSEGVLFFDRFCRVSALGAIDLFGRVWMRDDFKLGQYSAFGFVEVAQKIVLRWGLLRDRQGTPSAGPKFQGVPGENLRRPRHSQRCTGGSRRYRQDAACFRVALHGGHGEPPREGGRRNLDHGLRRGGDPT